MDKLLEDAKVAGFYVDSFKCIWAEDLPINDEIAKFAALQQPQWTSVDDRLPEDNIDVIALESDGKLYRLHKSTDKYCMLWKDKDNYYYHEVTHWMPLPEPPINTEVT